MGSIESTGTTLYPLVIQRIEEVDGHRFFFRATVDNSDEHADTEELLEEWQDKMDERRRMSELAGGGK